MIQLIVNADDFGLTDEVSTGIIDAHLRGIVTSATIMANGAAFNTAVSIRRRAPGLGIGVHLNLAAGQPVASARNIPSLVDSNGRLHWSPGSLLRALVARKVNLAEIETELRAQIAKVFAAGIRRRTWTDISTCICCQACGHCDPPGPGVLYSGHTLSEGDRA